jgi:putative membrane protein
MTTADLPALNACLNATSATLLLIGYFQIRRKRIAAHRFCMSAAFFTSVLFLSSYLYYHSQHGSTGFQGTGAVRLVYFTILLTHTVLAAVIVPMILLTFQRALKSEFARHRALARWTLPLWLYVSVTGVIIYLMLYQMY